MKISTNIDKKYKFSGIKFKNKLISLKKSSTILKNSFKKSKFSFRTTCLMFGLKSNKEVSPQAKINHPMINNNTSLQKVKKISTTILHSHKECLRKAVSR